MRSLTRCTILMTVWMLLAALLSQAQIVDPYAPPDVGVQVNLGEPRLLMLGSEGRLDWGSFQSPWIWQHRDGRLIVRVTSSQDISYNPQVDWPRYYFVSADGGATWSYIAPGKEEERRWEMEAGDRLADGTQVYFGKRRIVLADALRQRVLIGGEAVRKGTKFPGILAKDLPEDLGWIPFYTRKPTDAQWTQHRAYPPPGLRLPIIKIVDHEKAGVQTSDESYRDLFERLEQGDPSVPFLEQIELGTTVGSLDVLSDGSWISVVNYVDHDLPTLAGGYANSTPAGERPLAAVLRSTDQGEHWTVWREVPFGDQVIDVGDSVPASVPQPQQDGRRRHWVYRAHMNVMPDGSWVVMTRCCRDPKRWTDHAVLFLTRSTDQGLTWTRLEPIRPYSLNPSGAVLANGIGVRKYGRPGHYLTFCADGRGERWGNDVVLIGREREHDQDTCNNNNFVVTGPDRLIIAYSDFGYKDAAGVARKAIFTREIVAQPMSLGSPK